MGIGCSLQTFVKHQQSSYMVLFVLKQCPFFLKRGPFCPGTWSVLSCDVVRFVLKRGPFCLVRFVHGPFCPSTGRSYMCSKYWVTLFHTMSYALWAKRKKVNCNIASMLDLSSYERAKVSWRQNI